MNVDAAANTKVYEINGEKYRLTDEEFKEINEKSHTEYELQYLLSGKKVEDADLEQSVGNAAFGGISSYNNGVKLSTANDIDANYQLVDNKDAQKELYEKCKAEFKEQYNKSTLEERLNYAIDIYGADQLNKRIEEIEKYSSTVNIYQYGEKCFTDEEKEECKAKYSEYSNYYSKLMGLNYKDENGNECEPVSYEDLTEDDKIALEKMKQEFSTQFPEEAEKFDTRYGASFEIRNCHEAQKQERIEQAMALAEIKARRDIIAQKQGLDSADNLNQDQIRELAKAQMREQITHEDEIAQYQDKLDNDSSLTDKEKKELKELIKNREEWRDNDLKKIDENSAADYAQAQVEYFTWRQAYKSTEVHWDKDGAKDANANAEEGSVEIHTYLDKDMQEMVKLDPERFGCKQAESGSDFDFEDKDGNKWKFDSSSYKQAMLDAANKTPSGADKQGEYETKGIDYYADPTEWSELANDLKSIDQKNKGKKRLDKPATMSDRKTIRKMFQAAGIQASDDDTYKKRGKKIGKAALAGAGAGALAGLMGEVGKACSTVKYSGTATAIASGVISTTVSGSGTVEATSTSTNYNYDSLTGNWIQVGKQTTTQNIPYTYTQDVTVEYSDEVEAPYKGSKKPKFEFVNILKGAGIGAGIGAFWAGLKTLFKHKKPADYADEKTIDDYVRENTGYQKIDEEVIKVQDLNIIEKPQDCQSDMEQTEEAVTDTKEAYGYKLGKGETLYNVVKAKYNITDPKEIKAAVREIRRLNGIDESGMENGQVIIPNINLNGQTLRDAYWLPAEVLDGRYGLDTDAKVSTVKYTPGKGGVAKPATKPAAIIRNKTTGKWVVTDCNGTKFEFDTPEGATNKRNELNKATVDRVLEWNKNHPNDPIAWETWMDNYK